MNQWRAQLEGFFFLKYHQSTAFCLPKSTPKMSDGLIEPQRRCTLVTYILRRRSICIPPVLWCWGWIQQLWRRWENLSRMSECWLLAPERMLQTKRVSAIYDIFLGSNFLIPFSLKPQNSYRPINMAQAINFHLSIIYKIDPFVPLTHIKSMSHFFREIHVL